MDYIDSIFGPAGIIAQRLAGYETRLGQIDLAREIDRAFCDGVHCITEGPTGIGKSIAYGVPAIAHAIYNGKRCVIATANIALQEQLFYKDLPFLQSVLPFKFTFSLLKGKGNYFCHDRRTSGVADESFERLRRQGFKTQLARVLEWASHTTFGDKTELSPAAPEKVWAAVSTTSDDCLGANCLHADVCFFNLARARASKTNIVVTNYHLLFAHIAVRKVTGADLILPPFEHLILDEAHEAAEIARDFMGFRLSHFVFTKLARWFRAMNKSDLAAALSQQSDEFFAAVKRVHDAPTWKIRLRAPNWDASAHVKLASALEKCEVYAQTAVESQDVTKEIRAQAAAALDGIRGARFRLLSAVHLSDANMVYWIEVAEKGYPVLRAKPVDVSAILRQDLFEATRVTILSSATLSTGGSFDFIKEELGFPPACREITVPSPFNYTDQALLIVPERLPDTKDDNFPHAVASVIGDVVHACKGRTLCLFTSNKNMKAAFKLVQQMNLPFRLLIQGEDMQRGELYRTFKNDESSVLFGVASFWTGVDVPGEALIGLVIDKLPFPNLSDPLVNAISETRKNSFMHYMVPRAILTLRQGIGRLIRRQDDYGTVVVCDKRIVEHPSYAKAFLQSLPPMTATRDMLQLEPFIRSRLGANPIGSIPAPSPAPGPIEGVG